MDDCELLREYQERRSEPAFTELVERHLGLVYSVALRVVREPSAAQDVAQAVFIQLARRPWTARQGGSLAGWLYRATRCDALDAVRRETRRQQRESEAMNQAAMNSPPEIVPEQIAPLLEEAMGHLRRDEQDAVILRFYEGKTLRETGALLALSEEAARKRVDRALDKMRAHFARAGITASTALLTTALTAHAAEPPPAGLAAKVAGASVAGTAGVGGFSHLLEKIFFMSAKIKIALVVAAVGAAFVAGRSPELFYSRTTVVQKNLGQNRSTRSSVEGDLQSPIAVGDIAYSTTPDEEILQLIAEGPKQGMVELAKLPPGARTLNAYQLAFADWAQDPANAPGVTAMAYALDEGFNRNLALKGAIEGWLHSNATAALDWADKLAPTDSEPLKDALLSLSNAQGNPQLAARHVDNFHDASARNEAIQSIARNWAFDDFGSVNGTDPAAALDWLGQVATGDTYDNNAEYIVKNVAQHNPAAAATLLNKVTDAYVRKILMMNVATTWARANRPDALTWLHTLPDADAATRDALVQELSQTQTETSVNPFP